MIIHTFNELLSDSLKKELHDAIMKDEFIFPDKQTPNPIYSSFQVSTKPHFPENVENFYYDRVAKILNELGLMGRVSVYATKWCQIYNNSMGGCHPAHAHYSGSELFSWVNFVEAPTDQKCFYFLDTDGVRHYPDTQNSGDFIVFPSWALHGVDPVENPTVNRTIVSGNIICSKYRDLPDDNMSFVARQRVVKGQQQLVWTMEPNHG